MGKPAEFAFNTTFLTRCDSRQLDDFDAAVKRKTKGTSTRSDVIRELMNNYSGSSAGEPEKPAEDE